jgi:hypothetical protein
LGMYWTMYGQTVTSFGPNSHRNRASTVTSVGDKTGGVSALGNAIRTESVHCVQSSPPFSIPKSLIPLPGRQLKPASSSPSVTRAAVSWRFANEKCQYFGPCVLRNYGRTTVETGRPGFGKCGDVPCVTTAIS